jgi:uncharacterized protein YggE
MSRLKLFVLGIAIFSMNIASSQALIEQEEKPHIDVVGTAVKEIVPDEIYLSIIIKERYEGKEKIDVESQEIQLKNSLKEIGINLNDFYLSDVNADLVRIKWRAKDLLSQKDYTLKVDGATTVGKVFIQLDKLKIYDALIWKVYHSKMDSLIKETNITAIKAAKEKADYLLGALGGQTGKVIWVNDSGASVAPVLYVNSNERLDLSFGKFKNDDLQFQKIKISASIQVKFQIK